MKVLLAKTGPLQGNTYTIDGRTLIGRDGESDIQVIDRGVSRKHVCVLELDDGTVLLRDLGSHNGTWVGGSRVIEAMLSPGHEFSVGDTSFEYRITESDSAATQELDIKLMSGPAQGSTMTAELTVQERESLVAQALAERRAAALAKSAAAAIAVPASCCGSPLSAQAREQRWKFCPACGATLS